jgi:F-type H+-transporting ATPase subunit gamma
MSQRHAIEARLSLYDELSGILSAMRSFALTELHRVNQRQIDQQQVVDALTTVMGQLSAYLPQSGNDLKQPPLHICLLLGTKRGFCGSLNDDLIRFYQTEITEPNIQLFLVGERLHTLFGEQPNICCINGGEGVLDATQVTDRIWTAISRLRDINTGNLTLSACLHNEHGIQLQTLWPIPSTNTPPAAYPPLTLAPLAEVAAGTALHYLYHQLLALLFHAIHSENHLRLMQMENALQHLQNGTEELRRQRNRLRQEEITEEIELMFGRS